ASAASAGRTEDRALHTRAAAPSRPSRASSRRTTRGASDQTSSRPSRELLDTHAEDLVAAIDALHTKTILIDRLKFVVRARILYQLADGDYHFWSGDDRIRKSVRKLEEPFL